MVTETPAQKPFVPVLPDGGGQYPTEPAKHWNPAPGGTTYPQTNIVDSEAYALSHPAAPKVQVLPGPGGIVAVPEGSGKEPTLSPGQNYAVSTYGGVTYYTPVSTGVAGLVSKNMTYGLPLPTSPFQTNAVWGSSENIKPLTETERQQNILWNIEYQNQPTFTIKQAILPEPLTNAFVTGFYTTSTGLGAFQLFEQGVTYVKAAAGGVSPKVYGENLKSDIWGAATAKDYPVSIAGFSPVFIMGVAGSLAGGIPFGKTVAEFKGMSFKNLNAKGTGTGKLYEVTTAKGVAETKTGLTVNPMTGKPEYLYKSVEPVGLDIYRTYTKPPPLTRGYESIQYGISEQVGEIGMARAFRIAPTNYYIVDRGALLKSTIPSFTKAEIGNINAMARENFISSPYGHIEFKSGNYIMALHGQGEFNYLTKTVPPVLWYTTGYQTEYFAFIKPIEGAAKGVNVLQGVPPYPKTPWSKTPYLEEAPVSTPSYSIPVSYKANMGMGSQATQLSAADLITIGDRAQAQTIFVRGVPQWDYGPFLTPPGVGGGLFGVLKGPGTLTGPQFKQTGREGVLKPGVQIFQAPETKFDTGTLFGGDTGIKTDTGLISGGRGGQLQTNEQIVSFKPVSLQTQAPLSAQRFAQPQNVFVKTQFAFQPPAFPGATWGQGHGVAEKKKKAPGRPFGKTGGRLFERSNLKPRYDLLTQTVYGALGKPLKPPPRTTAVKRLFGSKLYGPSGAFFSFGPGDIKRRR